MRRRGIYAFVKDNAVENPVKYIGITDELFKPIIERLQRYQKEKREGFTSHRVSGHILEALKNNSTIKIYTLIPDDEIEFKKIPIDLVKGLEYPLIDYFKCEWNIRGKR